MKIEYLNVERVQYFNLPENVAFEIFITPLLLLLYIGYNASAFYFNGQRATICTLYIAHNYVQQLRER